MSSKTLYVTFFLLCLSLTQSLRAQEIGLQLYSLKDQFAKDLPGTLTRIKELGIKHLEIDGTYGLSFPDFMKLLAKNDLTVISFAKDFQTLEKFPQSVADEARSFGAKYVVCSWIPHNGTEFTKQDVDRAAAVFSAAGKVLARNGLLLCYQPNGYEFKSHEQNTLFDYMMKSFDSRVVHFKMDVFWIKQSGQDPVQLLKKYPTRFVLMDIRDRKRGTKFNTNGEAEADSNVALGKGDVGIAEVMKTARELGIQHYFLEDVSPRADKQIPQSIEYLKKLN